MKTTGRLNVKRGPMSLVAFNGSELRNAGKPAQAETMTSTPATAAQAFGHGILTHSASSRKRLTMPKDQVWRLEPEEVPSSVRVVSGALWITEDGDLRDHVIQSSSRLDGQRFQFNQQAGALISALEDSELEVA